MSQAKDCDKVTVVWPLENMCNCIIYFSLHVHLLFCVVTHPLSPTAISGFNFNHNWWIHSDKALDFISRIIYGLSWCPFFLKRTTYCLSCWHVHPSTQPEPQGALWPWGCSHLGQDPGTGARDLLESSSLEVFKTQDAYSSVVAALS